MDTDLYGYCDAEFAGDTEDWQSTGGYVLFLGNGAILWASQKQPTMDLSLRMALTEALREIVWI